MSDMGIFRTHIAIAPLAAPENRREIEAMVDTGSEYNWVPRSLLEQLGVAFHRVERFETANGQVLERDIGFAMLYAAGRVTATVVVFAEHGDMTLLGAIGLEGLNLRVDLARRELVPAGPVPVANLLVTNVSSTVRADGGQAYTHRPRAGKHLTVQTRSSSTATAPSN